MEQLTFSQWLLIISILLTIISIIIHICVLRALKKSTNQGITDKIDGAITNLANTAGKVLKSLNLGGVADVIHLVKDLITTPDTTTGEGEDGKQNGGN